MRNLSNADIGIFFHIPNEQAGKLESVISCIRNVFDICSHSMVKDEYWNFYADNLHIRRSIHFSEDDTRTWEAKKSSFPANVDYIESTLIVVDKKGTEKKLSAYATLNPMVTETIPMVHNERTVKFSIPNSVWKEMERTQVVNTVQVACAILDASYACIDIDFFALAAYIEVTFAYLELTVTTYALRIGFLLYVGHNISLQECCQVLRIFH